MRAKLSNKPGKARKTRKNLTNSSLALFAGSKRYTIRKIVDKRRITNLEPEIAGKSRRNLEKVAPKFFRFGAGIEKISRESGIFLAPRF